MTQFRQTLPAVGRINVSRQDLLCKVLLVSLLAHGATIELHQPLEIQGFGIPSNSSSFTAAMSAFNVLANINIANIPYVDPIVGVSAPASKTALLVVLMYSPCSSCWPWLPES